MRRALLAAAILVPAMIGVSPVARAQPIQGLYVGVGAGGNWLELERVRTTTVNGAAATLPGGGELNYNPGSTFLGSAGWAFGNGVRVEVEGSWRRNSATKSNVPPGLAAIGGEENKYGAMANVLFDMDIGSPWVYPYLGAGLGYQWIDQRRWQYGPGSQADSWSGTQGGFAYQAIAGAGFPIPWVVGLTGTAEFRYLGINGKYNFSGSQSVSGAAPATLTVKTSDENNFALLVGLRYAFNVTPPAPPPAAATAPVATPAPEPARSYLVFFDWAVLGERARQIVAEAAQATTRVQVTRIEVAGHADRTGTAEFNRKLSRRRADVVAAELVRLGVARSAISIEALGDRHPLVPTARGVREPQNRRVEIVLK
jgi:outer membrane protein OmpA-like peptidoglycan-associated protein